MSPHKRHVAVSDAARSDLNEILLYTEQTWNSRQRASYQRLIDETLRTLARSPELGRTRGELAIGLRSYPVGSHTLYYRVLQTALVVVRLLHARRDATREDRSLNQEPSERADAPE